MVGPMNFKKDRFFFFFFLILVEITQTIRRNILLRHNYTDGVRIVAIIKIDYTKTLSVWNVSLVCE